MLLCRSLLTMLHIKLIPYISFRVALFSGATNAATGGLFSGNRQPPKGTPQVVPQPGITQQQQQNMNQQHQQPQQNMNQQSQQNMNMNHGLGGGGGTLFGFGGQGQQQQNMQQQNMQQQNMQQGPNLMQKLGDITAPGSDMLSKGKELIFMKFGLGGK